MLRSGGSRSRQASKELRRKRTRLVSEARISEQFEWREVGEGSKEHTAPFAAVPIRRQPRAVIHFLGGALVGAVPRTTYGYLVSELASNGFAVVVGSYGLTFEHRASAVAVAQQLDSALLSLQLSEHVENGTLPLFAVGHSNGALLHTLIASLPELSQRSILPLGTALMGYNNLPISLAVPGGIPEQAPAVLSSGFSFIDSLPLPPAYRLLASALSDEDIAQQVRPIVGQLSSTLREARILKLDHSQFHLPMIFQMIGFCTHWVVQIAEGSQDFTPSPEESRRIVADGYKCPSTLFMRFANDSIDESATLSARLRCVVVLCTFLSVELTLILFALSSFAQECWSERRS